eukprot:GEMP01041683.1.p1 GENE.GEMP01041683.1~~GEMP01041683.1.p1  ORF type:complete len:204 (+),score=34.49 GEMP01041683.1:135-746(+)
MAAIGCHPGTASKPRPTRCTAAQHPLIPNDHPLLKRAMSLGDVSRKAPQKVPCELPCAYVDKFTTFDEYKASQTHESFYPGLYKLPTDKLYSGRLFGTRPGHFDWWKGKPYFDWWNVSSQSLGTFFRKDCPPRQHMVPSRRYTRVPPANVRDEVHAPKAKSPRHLAKRPEKTPPVPRFPLSDSPVLPYVPEVRGHFTKSLTTH